MAAGSTLLIQAAIKVGGSKQGRKIIGIVVGVICFIILFLLLTVVNFLSVFIPTGNSKMNDLKDIKESSAYQEVRACYDTYTATEIEKTKELAEKIYNDNFTYRVIEVYNESTKKTEKKQEWYCAADITIEEYQYAATAYTLAYLSCAKRNKFLKMKNLTIDEDELKTFWDSIGCQVEVDADDSDKENPKYLFYNPLLSLQEIAEKYFDSDTEQQKFYQSVYIFSQYIGQENFLPAFTADQLYAEKSMNIPLYYQYAKEWGDVRYGSGTISKTGCGPTCIAMVVTYLTGSTIKPDDVVGFVGNQYYVQGAGSSWDIFPACAAHWGIECTAIGLSPKMIANELAEGKPVILSMGQGMFTSSGHFIVLTGITSDGRVLVNDPNDNQNKNFKDKTFSISQILQEAKGGWSFDN